MNQNLHFLNNDSFRHTGSSKRIGLHVTDRVTLVILLAGPSLIAAMNLELSTGVQTGWLSVYVKKRNRDNKNEYLSKQNVNKSLTPWTF